MALLLTACGGGADTPTVPQPLTLSGTVVEGSFPDEVNLSTKAWTGGAGQVIAKNNETGAELARGTLNANGSFSLTLPATVSGLSTGYFDDLKDLNSGNTSGLSCTGTPSVSATGVQGTSAILTVDANKDGEISPLLAQGQFSSLPVTYNAKSGGAIYVDRAVSITGTQTCTGILEGLPATIRSTFNLNLRTGWNLVSASIDMTGTTNGINGTLAMTSGGLPTNNWVFGLNGSAQSLSLKSLNLPTLR